MKKFLTMLLAVVLAMLAVSAFAVNAQDDLGTADNPIQV